MAEPIDRLEQLIIENMANARRRLGFPHAQENVEAAQSSRHKLIPFVDFDVLTGEMRLDLESKLGEVELEEALALLRFAKKNKLSEKERFNLADTLADIQLSRMRKLRQRGILEESGPLGPEKSRTDRKAL